LASDIEKHNFGVTPKNDFLGWVGPEALHYFNAFDDNGHDIKTDLFTVKDSKLYTKETLRLFMVTPALKSPLKTACFIC